MLIQHIGLTNKILEIIRFGCFHHLASFHGAKFLLWKVKTLIGGVMLDLKFLRKFRITFAKYTSPSKQGIETFLFDKDFNLIHHSIRSIEKNENQRVKETNDKTDLKKDQTEGQEGIND
ncbi:MAG: hypothetical protein DRQ10_01310 [Candidatus Hydrothermota bacterium]|nr:MAG: hypothetical protein DRQ10_01310 [Candidatus Hydrothermae bacterium]